MNIPDKAVEAAARAEYLSPTPGLEFAVEPDWESLAEHEKQRWRDDVRASLEAAAPHIAEQALADFEAHLRDGLKSARGGGEQHLHEDALIMLDAYWAQK